MEKWEVDGPFYPQNEADFKKLGTWDNFSEEEKKFIREDEKIRKAYKAERERERRAMNQA